MGIVDSLREMADLFEAQQAPHNLVLHLRTGADEIDRLRAGGCARDQGLTQYCAEAAEKDARMHRMMFKMERWRGSLMNIAQGRGDPVAVACAALEADNE